MIRQRHTTVRCRLITIGRSHNDTHVKRIDSIVCFRIVTVRTTNVFYVSRWSFVYTRIFCFAHCRVVHTFFFRVCPYAVICAHFGGVVILGSSSSLGGVIIRHPRSLKERIASLCW